MDGSHSLKSYWDLLDDQRYRKMTGLSFHVYKGDKTVAVNLTVQELEDFLIENIKDISIHEIMPLEDVEYDDASY